VVHDNPDNTAFMGAFASVVEFVFSDGFISHVLDEEDANDSLVIHDPTTSYYTSRKRHQSLCFSTASPPGQTTSLSIPSASSSPQGARPLNGETKYADRKGL